MRAREPVHPHLRGEDHHRQDADPAARDDLARRRSRCSSSPRTSRARPWRRWCSTSSRASSRCAPSRPPATATAARPCSKTSPSSPAARRSSRTWASSSRTSSSTRPGPGQEGQDRRREHDHHRRHRRQEGDRRPRRDDPPRDRRRPTASTTARSCRSGWRSWPAAWPRSRSAAATETEMKERKALYEDALHATRAAIAEGIVPGGGVALLHARKVLDKLEARRRRGSWASACCTSVAGDAVPADRRERRPGRHRRRQQHPARARTRTTATTPTPTSTTTCARPASSTR